MGTRAPHLPLFGTRAARARHSGQATRPTPCNHAYSSTAPLVFGETRPTTPLVAGPPTAPAVAAEGASCAARAVPSDSVSCMLAARRVPTGRFADGVPGAGREPSASVMTKREQRGSVSPATRLQRSQEIWVTTIRLSSARMGAFLLAAAEAATALGTGGGRLCEAAAATDAACERRRPQRRPPRRRPLCLA